MVIIVTTAVGLIQRMRLRRHVKGLETFMVSSEFLIRFAALPHTEPT
jgi:hypothetical protein